MLTNGVGAGSLAIDASGHIWAPTGVGPVLETKIDGSLVTGEPTSGWPAGPSAVPGNTYGGIAIDAQGDAWMRYSLYSSANRAYQSGLIEVSPSGQTLIGPGTVGLLDTGANSLAIDGANTVWVPNLIGSISHFAHDGTAISPTNGYQNSVPRLVANLSLGGTLALTSFALDGSGNAWATSYTSGVLVEYVGVAAPVATPLSLNLVNNSIGQRP